MTDPTVVEAPRCTATDKPGHGNWRRIQCERAAAWRVEGVGPGNGDMDYCDYHVEGYLNQISPPPIVALETPEHPNDTRNA